MENSHKLALYVSYYLSRFNNEALVNLGYPTWRIAFKDIASKLDVKPNSVKNWRDEFDPIYRHRAGWYQRPMIKSRIQIVRALEELDELQIRMIVDDILSGDIRKDPDEMEQLLSLVSNNEKKKGDGRFILRTPTGKRAEEYFIEFHTKTREPMAGNLIDCRDMGVGYDFKIKKEKLFALIEVKGLSDPSGGILFTDKEWTMAQRKRGNYYLAVITNLSKSPVVKIINDPASKLSPKKNIYTAVQISWSVSEKDLNII